MSYLSFSASSTTAATTTTTTAMIIQATMIQIQYVHKHIISYINIMKKKKEQMHMDQTKK